MFDSNPGYLGSGSSYGEDHARLPATKFKTREEYEEYLRWWRAQRQQSALSRLRQEGEGLEELMTAEDVPLPPPQYDTGWHTHTTQQTTSGPIYPVPQPARSNLDGYGTPRSSYGDGGFWRVAQNSQALGRYNGLGLRRNRASGSGVMPYGSMVAEALTIPGKAYDTFRSWPFPLQLMLGVIGVGVAYGVGEQRGWIR